MVTATVQGRATAGRRHVTGDDGPGAEPTGSHSKMEEEITFIPHPNTLTATGDQNYRDSDRGKKAFPFAIAEKIVS